MPRILPKEGSRSRPIQDTVIVDLAPSTVSSMKRLINRCTIFDYDIRRKEAVQAFCKDIRRQSRLQAKACDLARGMYPGIGSSRSDQGDRLSRYRLQGILIQGLK